jgi:hypothetical protein
MRTRRAHIPAATLTVREVVAGLLLPITVEDAEVRIAALARRREAVLTASARGAIAAAVHAIDPSATSVAIPAYTCAAVPNAVQAAGATVRYVDVEGNGLVAAGSWPAGVGLVVTQDTYGFEADAPSVDVPFIRDGAHRAELRGFGGEKILITSLEQSKALSAGQGGIALTDDPLLARRMREFRDAHPVDASGLGHGIVTLLTIWLGRELWRGHPNTARAIAHIIGRLAPERLAGQTRAELAGSGLPASMLGSTNRFVARLAVGQLARSSGLAKLRTARVSQYDRAAGIERVPRPLLRYPLLSSDPHHFETSLLRAGWDLRGRWFAAPLHPEGADEVALGLDRSTVPAAAHLAAHVVNLPTHPLVSPRQAETLIRLALDAGATPLQ